MKENYLKLKRIKKRRLKQSEYVQIKNMENLEKYSEKNY